jgi:cell division protein FtsB
MMKMLNGLLVLLIVLFQYQLWLGDGSARALNLLEVDLDSQRASNDELELRNKQLEIEVLDLKNGLEAVEERARAELGMIGERETFYLIIE